MGRPTKTQAVLIKELQERQSVLEGKLSKVRTRKHHELAKIISQLLSDVKAMKEQISRLDEKDAVSPILIGQIESLKNADEVLNQRITVLEEGQIKLAELTATTARTVKEHGDVLDTHSGRLNALESATSGISTAVARAQAQIEALQQGYRFNFLSAAIAAGIGLAVYFFWYVPHSFSGSVLDAHHQATGQIVRSLLDTGWGNAMGLLVVFLFTIGAGYLFARNSASQTRMMASTRAEASVSTRPITRIGSSSGASSDVRGSVDSPTGAH